MVGKALFFVTGLSAALLTAAPQADAQSGAPRVRLTSQPFGAQSTIAPSISLSEPAYILAVAIDRDGQVSVLSPVGPNDLIKFDATKSLRLPEFFAGFSSGYWGRYSGYQNASFIRSVTDDYSAGSVLVVASRTPFNFAAITDGPFWNEDAIKRLVRFRDPSSAVYTLGRAVSAKGQSFGHDVLRFGAPRYLIASADPCSSLGFSPYGYSSGDLYNNLSYSAYDHGYVLLTPTPVSNGLQLVRFGTDACGRVRYVLVPIRVLPPNDTTAIPKDSVKPAPATKTIIADAAPGTYTGEAAVRVFEMIKNRANTDTYAGLAHMPILQEEKSTGSTARPVSRDATPPERVESFERVRNANATPIERAAPVIRQAEPQHERPSQPVMRSEPMTQPIMRSEPVSQSAGQVQRDSKPVEVVSPTKDN